MTDTFVKISALDVADLADAINTALPITTSTDTTPTTQRASLDEVNKQSYQAKPVAAATDLRNVLQPLTRDGQLAGTIDTRIQYIYKADSTEVDDGINVLAPTWAGATGRWEIFSSGGGGDFDSILVDPISGAVLTDPISGNVLVAP